MSTPTFERLAARTAVFERAYVQVALCMPSRTSLLTSRRPDTSRSWTIEADQYFRRSGGNFTTLPQALKDRFGYLAIGMGKVFHEGANCAWQDANYSWSRESLLPHASGGEDPKPGGRGSLFDPAGDEDQLGGKGKLAHAFDDEDEPRLQDGKITGHAVGVIKDLGRRRVAGNLTQPFFLAVGLHRPHVPWMAPRRFFDLYKLSDDDDDDDDDDREEDPGQVGDDKKERSHNNRRLFVGKQDQARPNRAPWPRAAPCTHLPKAAPNVAFQDWQVRDWCQGDTDLSRDQERACHLSTHYPLDNTTVPAAAAAYMRQGYFASTSWTDANIGIILDAFDAAPGLDLNETIIVVWGDHGWHLGDADQWAKMTNFEAALRIPLLIGAPGMMMQDDSSNNGGGAGHGRRVPDIVEAIDIMPTIIDLATGSPPPPCPTSSRSASRAIEFCTEGRSLRGLVMGKVTGKAMIEISSKDGDDDDDDDDDGEPAAAAYSQFPRPEHPAQR